MINKYNKQGVLYYFSFIFQVIWLYYETYSWNVWNHSQRWLLLFFDCFLWVPTLRVPTATWHAQSTSQGLNHHGILCLCYVTGKSSTQRYDTVRVYQNVSWLHERAFCCHCIYGHCTFVSLNFGFNFSRVETSFPSWKLTEMANLCRVCCNPLKLHDRKFRNKLHHMWLKLVLTPIRTWRLQKDNGSVD